MPYLWRAVGQKGEVLASYVTKTRAKAAVVVFMQKALTCGAELAFMPPQRSEQAAQKTLGFCVVLELDGR